MHCFLNGLGYRNSMLPVTNTQQEMQYLSEICFKLVLQVCWQLVTEMNNKGRKTCSFRKSWTDKSGERRKIALGCVRESGDRRFIYSSLDKLKDQVHLAGSIKIRVKRRSEAKKRNKIRDHLSFPRLSFKVSQTQHGVKPEMRPQM